MDFANVLHQILIENSYVLNRKYIEEGLPIVGHPFKLDSLTRKSIENYMAYKGTSLKRYLIDNDLS